MAARCANGFTAVELFAGAGGLRDYLATHNIEGIVFWLNGEPMCKIKRTDYGFKWPS